MQMTEPLWVLVVWASACALGAGIVALGAWLLPKLKHEEQGYPLEVQIEAALLPIAFEGICAAYRLSEMAMDELGERIRGADKKQVANFIYDMIPDQVGKFPVSVIKAIVTRERFAAIVETAFASFDRRFVEQQFRYDELFEEWKKKMEAERTGQPVPLTYWAEPWTSTAAP